MRAIIVLAVLFLCACGAKTARPDYYAYLQQANASQQQAQAEREKIASAAASCPKDDGTCVVAVAGFAAMAAQGAGARQGIAPPPRERDWAEKLGSVLAGISPLAQTAAGVVQSRYSRDIALGQQSMLESIVVGSTSAVAEVAAGAQPNITVNGNWGDTRGDTLGDDATFGDRAETNVGRDVIAGNRVDNTGVIHDGDNDRYGSDGPISNDGDECSGDCSTVPDPDGG